MRGYVLKCVSGPQTGLELELKAGLLCLGQGEPGDKRYGWLLLTDTSVSPHHANLNWLPQERQFLLEHISESGKTLIDGREVKGSCVVNHGARIQIGTTELLFQRRSISLSFTSIDDSAATPESSSKPKLQSHPNCEQRWYVEALSSGQRQEMTKGFPTQFGRLVQAVWSSGLGRFIIKASTNSRVTVRRKVGPKEQFLSAAMETITLQDGDLLSVDNAQFLVSCVGFEKKSEIKKAKIRQEPESLGQLGHYRIEGYKPVRHLGNGETGEVLAMRDPRGQVVAVKFIRPQLMKDRDALLRLRNEAKLASCLRHPNLQRVFGQGVTPSGRAYLINDFIQGETLRQWLKREHTLSLEFVASKLRGIAMALDYLHQRGLVHRDVKPENIFLVQAGAVLGDFGVATAISDPRFAVGTPAYMAPEQAQGQSGPTSDQYSLGVVVFEMLAGHRPFEGVDPQAMAKAHLKHPVPDLKKIRPELSVQAVTVINKMLSKVPKKRFASTLEALDSLSNSS